MSVRLGTMHSGERFEGERHAKQAQKNLPSHAALTTFLAVLALTLFSNAAAAATIGASPARVDFPETLRGGYAESQFSVSTNNDELLIGHIEVEGNIKAWISFSPNTTIFNVTINSPTTITAVVQPPQDTPLGTYTGKITVVGDSTAKIGGRAGSVVQTSVILPVTVPVTGRQTIGCTAGALEFDDIEEGLPILIWATVKNTGNVRLAPLITFSVWDSLQEKVILKKELRGKEVLPTRTERILATAENSLTTGQYWVDVSLPECDSQALLTFSVVEKGGMVDKGELTELNAPAKATVGETVPITAVFFNSGKRVVTAQLKGVVKKDDKVIELISSDSVNVEAGKVEKLTAYFIPKEQGQYSASARIVYNKKLTFEKNANFIVERQVREAATAPGFLSPLIIYVILTATALFIIRKIRQRKRRPF